MRKTTSPERLRYAFDQTIARGAVAQADDCIVSQSPLPPWWKPPDSAGRSPSDTA